jgi:hypothetical protein
MVPAGGGDGLDQPRPDDVHGHEHVALREPDADVSTADARALLIVAVVVRAREEPHQPRAQQLLLTRDLRLVLEDRARLRVGVDGHVESVDDGVERGGEGS